MAADASDILGARQIASVNVMPRGDTWSNAWRQGGMGVGGIVGAGVGELASGEAAKRGTTAEAETPKFGGKALLALTDEEVALVTLRSGSLTSKAGDVIARLPRNQVTQAALADGMVPKLSITFADGSAWSMDVPRVFKRRGDTKRIVELLGG